MAYLTEAEATRLVCPYTLGPPTSISVAGAPGAPGSGGQGGSAVIHGGTDGGPCIGSRCMAWESVERLSRRGVCRRLHPIVLTTAA